MLLRAVLHCEQVHQAHISFMKYVVEELKLGRFQRNADGETLVKDPQFGNFDGYGTGNHFLRLAEELVALTLRGPHQLHAMLKESAALPPATRVLVHTLNNHAHVMWPMKSQI